ncbi:hypothetical protein LSTR_LSTR001068 [Laodelphax striatellus]|uniref:Major facilitator superfamily (MFS) profile domain-containing protein n=1 Tax=Laodelphax striatellus TaxID=195883 RepID=A0A482X119_LAOST|nr:hypothetical protein LSTR_LSTR001068 [Laodelphax striatellus]
MRKDEIFTIATTEQKKDIEDPEENVKFEDALAKTGYGLFNAKITVIGALAIGCSYIGVGAISLILPSAQCDLEMTSIHKGHLISAGFIGIILSCHMWGFLSDTKGRRKIVLWCASIDGFLYALSSLSPYYSVFIVFRFFHGFATCGIVVPIYAYIGEFHTDKHRHTALLIASIFGCVGYFYIVGVGWSIISGSWQIEIVPSFIVKPWRLYYALLGVPSLICAIAMSFLPESPKFLIAKNRGGEALEVLRRVHKENGSRVPGQFKVKSLSWSFEEATHVKSESSKIGAFLSLMWKQTVPFFKHPYRKDIALICSIQFLLYLCNNGIFLWLPETGQRIAIFVEEHKGTSATFCHIVQNFDSSNNNNATYKSGPDPIYNRTNSGDAFSAQECKAEVSDRVYITMLTMSSCMTLTLVFLSLLMNIVPKKVVLCVSICAALAVTSLLTITEGTYILLFEMGAMLMFTGASIPIITNLVVDVFPTNFRAMAVCLTIMSARLGTITANQICGALLDSHCDIIIWILIASLIVSVIISFNLPTTKKVNN